MLGLILVIVSSNSKGQIILVPAPRDPPYICQTVTQVAGIIRACRRVTQDKGRYRSERLDPKTGRCTGMEVDNRDGQGTDFYYYGDLRKRLAGVDLDGIMFRLAKDNPRAYYERTRIPNGTATRVNEPTPAGGLRRFIPHPDSGYCKSDTAIVAGKKCDVYEPGVSGVPVRKGLERLRTRANATTRSDDSSNQHSVRR